jgi:hypothetical protein
MGYSQRFISLSNFELAFDRIVRGQNKDYKAFFQHLFPSYQVGLKDNLQDLISDIKRGRYSPSLPCVVFQPKKTGVLRPLRLLTLQDQVVYQSIANVIAIAFKPEQDKYALKQCYGALVDGKADQFFFRGWKQCYRAFDRAIVKTFKAGKDFVADFDLVSFYELIDHKLLDNVLKRRVKDLELLELLCRCLEKWAENHRGIQLHHGIPQGPEPSAFLAECVLFSFDAMRFKDVAYLRYIDDIKLMGKYETQVRRALLKLDIASKELGLVPQAQKIECRRVSSVDELRKNVPSRIASVAPNSQVTKTTHRRLERIFRRSLRKEKGRWNTIDVTKFKFALLRMKPKLVIADRITPLLDQRPDLSWVLASYFRKFPQNKRAADALLVALQRDPTYDASSANYIDAMDRCEPLTGITQYRRVIRTAERRSEEKSLLLRIAAATFRGRRSGPTDAVKLIRKEAHPLARSILIHRLFGNDQRAPFKVSDGFSLLTSETESSDADLARCCANLLLDRWPWTKATWKPTNKVNRSVKLFLKSLGLRANTPNRQGVLETFFTNKMRITVKLRWRKALGADWRDAERRCLRVQQFDTGDPTSWVLMTDTFNEVLLQAFSINHPRTAAAYVRAIPPGKHHPDVGNWLNNPAIAAVLPKSIPWL